MTRTGKFLLFFSFLFFCSTYLHAGEISISASLDREEIYIDDTVQLTIKISGSVGSIPDPDISSLSKDFQIVGSSTSTSISVINGSFQAEKDVILQLKPLHSGVITIKDIFVEQGGKRYYINPLTLKVITTYQLPATSSTGSNYAASFTGYNIPQSIRYSGIGVLAEVNKRKVYVGEEFLYRFIFINRISIMGNPSYSPPSFKGVWKYDLLREPITRRIVIDGYPYQIQELRTALIPLSPGKLVIPPAKLSVPLDFFTGTKIFRTRPLVVKVYPLPETGKTDCFTGAVGDGYRVKLKKTSITTTVNEPVQIDLEITGPGNLNLSAPPPVTAGEHMKYFKPQINDSIVTTPEGTIVDRNITYILQPLKPGSYTVGPIRFCYFSPSSATYREINAGSVKITVLPPVSKASVEKKKKEVILRPPVNDFTIINFPGKFTSWLIAFWSVKWLPFAFLAFFSLIVFLIVALSKNYAYSAGERRKRKMLSQMEKQMLKFVRKGNIEEFYRLWKSYFKIRWGMNVDILSEDEIRKFEGESIPPGSGEVILKVNEFLHNYQFANRTTSDEWKKYAEEFIKRVRKWEE